MDHPNVIKIVDRVQGFWSRPGKKDQEVSALVLEYAIGGSLYTWVEESGRFSEYLARYYFKQLIDGVNEIHSNGYSHRDLKGCNLLLDQNSDLKIADFGYSRKSEGKDKSGFLTTLCGTENHNPPELQNGEGPWRYQGPPVDMF